MIWNEGQVVDATPVPEEERTGDSLVLVMACAVSGFLIGVVLTSLMMS